MSSQFENEVAKTVHRNTPSAVRAYRCGYSGSNAMPQPDVLVTTPTVNYGVELKGPLARDHIYVDEDDLQQLVDCANATTVVALGVKFQRREMMIVRHFEDISGKHPHADRYDEMSVAKQFAVLAPDAFDPSTTDSGSLRLEKPSTENWPSATAGTDDEVALLSGLGIVGHADDTEVL